MRPVDVTRAYNDNIVTIDGQLFYRYTPEKKKNNPQTNNDKITRARLNDVALPIIDKYKGKSSRVYIFPFSLNEYDWDMMNANSWSKWNNRKAKKWLRLLTGMLCHTSTLSDTQPLHTLVCLREQTLCLYP